MNALQQTTIIVLSILAIFNSSCLTVFANQSDSINPSKSTQFASNLKSKIQNLISGESNDSSDLFNSNSGAFLDNNSNMSSNQLIISSNKITTSISNNSSGNNSFVKDKVTIINGVCKSEKVAGNGNDTLFSTGNCNDELTGGTGADKFSCGEGNDTIKDYDPKEGDIILDQQNCENIL